MRILEKILTAVLYFFVFTAPCTAHIIALKLHSDNRHMIPFFDFEFSNVGYVSFVLSSVTVTSTSSSPPDPSRIGFLFQSHKPEDEQPFKFQQNTTICDLDFKLNSSVLFTFQNLSYDTRTSFNKTYPVTDPGMKSFFFFNCNNESLVTMDGGMELYNIDEGTTKNYLSAGLTQLPFLYIILSFIYLSFLGFWILVCFKNRRCFQRTHLLMGGLLVFSIVHFICVAADLHYVKVTGSAHELDVLFFVLQLIRDPILPWEAAMPYNKLDWSIADIMGCFFILIPIARPVDRMTLKMATPNEESCMLSTSISDSCLHSPV
ncbi:unnamed protein product [Lactuca virosa]|uniref:CAND6/7 N-terminal domain-containing protein n=1 Tax=Lactuca virosa TaxID=75947 RepID=A0AAU9LN90_9ASTR|nr:unnamed protein product [Lactuca virosa]